MAGLQICPVCFAEVYQSTKCDFCGAVIPDHNDDFDPMIQSPSSLVPFELAGEWIQRFDWSEYPKGTLFIGRFSLLQYKQRIGSGLCYIAFDHHVGHHCFVSLWKEPEPMCDYHHRIVQLSPVYSVGTEPLYSAFMPQEGMELIETLQRLGWSHGRVWEVFRQMCHLMSTAHANGLTIGGFHPNNCWIAPDGRLEMSLQPKNTVGTTTVQQDVQHLIYALGWLFGQSAEIDWSVFPLILRGVLQQHWESSQGAADLWKDLQVQIQSGGWYRLEEAVRQELLERHSPGRLRLGEQIISVPETVPLCAWNSVSASWRLHEGRVVLCSTIEALYESGFLDSEDYADRLEHFSRVVSQQEQELLTEDITEIFWHLVYGSRRKARLILAKKIPTYNKVNQWITLIQGFQSLHEIKEAYEIVEIAKNSVSSIRESLELAAVIRWNLNDVSACRRYMMNLIPLCQSPWDWLDWVEASVCLFNWSEVPTMVENSCKSTYETLAGNSKEEYTSVMWLRFGPLGETLFPWLSQDVLKSSVRE